MVCPQVIYSLKIFLKKIIFTDISFYLAFVVLQKCDFIVEVYYASEISTDAIQVSQHHFGDKIKNLGDVKSIGPKTLREIGPIHLLVGGSPCEELSRVNHLRKGLKGIVET